MSLLNNIKSSADRRPGLRAVIAGVEKIGKTTLVCGAPGTLLVPLEAGYAGVIVDHTPLVTDYPSFITLLNELIAIMKSGQFCPYQTLALDSATALERLIHESVMIMDPSYRNGANKNLSMESALGGYGRAYTIANERFMEIVKLLDVLAIEYGMNILFTCHVFPAKIVDPTAGEYDTWDLLLHSPKNQKTYGKREFITQWADLIGFLYEPILISESNNVSKGISENKGRIMGLSRTPGYVAGNRFGMNGEISIPKEEGWNYLAHAIYQASGFDVFKR